MEESETKMTRGETVEGYIYWSAIQAVDTVSNQMKTVQKKLEDSI